MDNLEIHQIHALFAQCTSLTTDSRQCGPGMMFVALKGERFNGNQFVTQALEKGCMYAMTDEPCAEWMDNPHIIVVDNCLLALQQLSNYHRRQWGKNIICITGTNGKTTTKELVAAVMGKGYIVHCTSGNLNNQIGVPLTLLQLKPTHEVAIIEAGASHPGDIRELVNIIEPDYGLITNVGLAHIQGFGSFEGVVRTKGELYDYLSQHGQRTVFIDAENEHLCAMATQVGQVPYVKGGLDTCAPYLNFHWTREGETYHVQTQLIGSYNLKNALAAITIGAHFLIAPEAINQAIAEYVPTNNRSQLTHTATNHLVVDAYNANPTSMRAALDNFRLMQVPHKWAILGDMKELGHSSEGAHHDIVDYLTQCGLEKVILVGPEFGHANTSGYEHYANVNQLIDSLEALKPTGCYILIKGSNSMNLCKLTTYL